MEITTKAEEPLLLDVEVTIHEQNQQEELQDQQEEQPKEEQLKEEQPREEQPKNSKKNHVTVQNMNPTIV